jgi:hypothetical protein
MFSKISAFAVAVSMMFASVSTFRSTPAQAFVGGYQASVTIVTIGIVGGTFSGTILAGVGHVKHNTALKIAGAALMVAGIVLWDANSGQAEFAPMTLAQARALGANVTAVEMDSYNENLDLLNLIADQVAADRPATAIESAKLWDKFAVGAPVAARQAGAKIVGALLK